MSQNLDDYPQQFSIDQIPVQHSIEDSKNSLRIEDLEETEEFFVYNESNKGFDGYKDLSLEKLEEQAIESDTDELKISEESISNLKIYPTTTIHSHKPIEGTDSGIICHSIKKVRKQPIVVEINLNEEESNDDQGIELDENLLETNKFDLPSFNKTLKKKELVTLTPLDRILLDNAHENTLLKNETSIKDHNLTINLPKSFKKNMKEIHRSYLRKHCKPQFMKKKDLKIEIPEPPKDEDLIRYRASLIKKNHMENRYVESMSKKRTNDMDIVIA